MQKNKRLLILSVILIIVLVACNLPNAESTEVPALELTLTAQAILSQTPAFTSTSEFTATPGPSATPAFTSTPTVPEVSVSVDTNCRTGPGLIYERVGGLLVGQKAVVVGKNSATGYWIINNPNSSGTCWLYGQYATVSGNTAGLTEYSIPPTPTPTATSTPTKTPTPSVPAPVNNPMVAKACIPLVLPNYQYGGVLSWEDKSDNETGFNIYLNGGLVNSVGANVTNAAIPPLPFPQGTPVTMGVEAFNVTGKAAIKTVIFSCP